MRWYEIINNKFPHHTTSKGLPLLYLKHTIIGKKAIQHRGGTNIIYSKCITKENTKFSLSSFHSKEKSNIINTTSLLRRSFTTLNNIKDLIDIQIELRYIAINENHIYIRYHKLHYDLTIIKSFKDIKMLRRTNASYKLPRNYLINIMHTLAWL